MTTTRHSPLTTHHSTTHQFQPNISKMLQGGVRTNWQPIRQDLPSLTQRLTSILVHGILVPPCSGRILRMLPTSNALGRFRPNPPTERSTTQPPIGCACPSASEMRISTSLPPRRTELLFSVALPRSKGSC